MKSISFDNPYLLLIAIPLVLAILIPYFISVSKDNKSKSWIGSLIIHFAIILCITLAAAGLVHTTVMTRTKVYILADVSYSSSRNLDKIDEYVQKINDSLPQNSRLGIVCFGKTVEILTSSGKEIRSVKEASVDDSGTDIATALDYTATLFSEGEIKRIILITDGNDTTYGSGILPVVERLTSAGIKIDAVYLDNNLKEGDSEVQISDVEYTSSTYLNHESMLKVLVESNTPADVVLDLYSKSSDETEYVKIDTSVVKCESGMNIFSFTLPTNESGTFDYRITAVNSEDVSDKNNAISFTQTVAGKRQVLLVTGQQQDVKTLTSLYGDSADIDPYVIGRANKSIPYSIESLSRYDEIVVANVDIREIDHINSFIDAVDISVSQYGKSLITLGNLNMQNKDDEVLRRFEELLPVSFGNANKDSKLYTIILDISRSMNDTSQLIIAKDAATKLLSILEDDDYVAYITLAGASIVEQTPKRLGDCRTELYEMIQSAEPCQGTFIGSSLSLAYDFMKDLNFEEKQVMLISDGLTYTYEPEDAVEYAKKMKNAGIAVSTVNVLSGRESQAVSLLSGIAGAGGGNYYLIDTAEDVAEVVFATIADELTESIVEEKTKVNIKTFRDSTMKGILSIPDVYGYVNSRAKLDTTSVLTVNYKKNEDTVVEVPLYVYREHGNGRVASFTSDLSTSWLGDWNDGTAEKFFMNVLVTNTPRENVTYPFTVNFEYLGPRTMLEIIPAYLNPGAVARIEIFSPSGEVYGEDLLFNLNKFVAYFETEEVGKYEIRITYSYAENIFTTSTVFTVSYFDEYDSFKPSSIGNVHSFIRGLGRISTDAAFDLSGDRTEVATYELSFRLPLLAAAAVLFVLDVFIRKLKINRKPKEQKKKGVENEA